ncbi:hypothetical protein [Streptomyces sp. DH37]|nr:hypothetical protein [Streptomyces sp. DH37]MDG9702575.1 hypothetical protein [Streptomyces sp. DH37]
MTLVVGFRTVDVGGVPALAKWLVPVVNAPGTTIAVSMPNGSTSAA